MLNSKSGWYSASRNVYCRTLWRKFALRGRGTKVHTDRFIGIHTLSHRKHNYTQRKIKSLIKECFLYLDFIVTNWKKLIDDVIHSPQHFAIGLTFMTDAVSSLQLFFSSLWPESTNYHRRHFWAFHIYQNTEVKQHLRSVHTVTWNPTKPLKWSQ